MPQNQLYEYDVKYNGYVFKLRGYREPTAEEVHKIYVDSVLAGNPFDSNTPSLDIGMSETDFLKYINQAIFNLKNDSMAEMSEITAKYDYRILTGANPEIQLSALLAELTKFSKIERDRFSDELGLC